MNSLTEILPHFTTKYSPEYDRCELWATWLLDSNRTLEHRAQLIRFLLKYPQHAMLVEVIMYIKTMNSTSKKCA
jgi:hypothetical protein